ncbi:MAG: porphobilinogen synthase [Oligoflexia bacterium]|nr:porphobilinogen synthase [Oligoflexia bacterium]
MKRLQRLRKNQWTRDLTATTEFNVAQLIQPLFVVEGLSQDQDIPGLKGNRRLTLQSSLKQVESDLEAGVRNFILFGVPQAKMGTPRSFQSTAQTVKEIKSRFGGAANLWVDTCLCSYTDHGHCCVFHQSGSRDHVGTLKALETMALELASAGADGISPSDMMDGRVAKIRSALDQAGFEDTPIMSYSTKFSSQFYGPFRAAADSAPQFGDRTQYQIDVRNRNDAIAASRRCAEEGADLLMVKPGMTAIDLIKPIHEQTGLAVGAYQVSGEYASLVLLEKEGLINFEKALQETWQVFKRAGAQFIITYGARFGRQLGVRG